MRLAGVPTLIAHPDWEGEGSALRARPWLLWIHGRSVTKELDPGRYLRLLRAGIASIAVDLPGHGERLEPDGQEIHRTLPMIAQMVDEVDAVVERVLELEGFDPERGAIGGMSAGGMVTLARLCRPHRFVAAAVECTTGSWRWQPNLMRGDPAVVARLNPIDHLDGWRPIPLLAMHNRRDAWVPIEGQEEFLTALAATYPDPQRIERQIFDETGAPYEHAGFGRMGSEAKDRFTAFLAAALLP
jgi:dienelactone hydrolase